MAAARAALGPTTTLTNICLTLMTCAKPPIWHTATAAQQLHTRTPPISTQAQCATCNSVTMLKVVQQWILGAKAGSYKARGAEMVLTASVMHKFARVTAWHRMRIKCSPLGVKQDPGRDEAAALRSAEWF